MNRVPFFSGSPDSPQDVICPAPLKALVPGSASVVVVGVFTILTISVAIHAPFFGAGNTHYEPFTFFEIVCLTSYHALRPLVIILMVTLTRVIVKHPELSVQIKVAWLSAMLIASTVAFVVGAYMAREVLRCGVVFCWGQEAGEDGHGDKMGLRANEGLLAMIFGLALFLAFSMILIRTLRCTGSPSRAETPTRNSLTSCRQKRRAGAAALLAAVVIPAMFLLTAVMPNNFQKLHLGGGEENYRLPNSMAAVVDDAETPEAWMKTLNLKVSDNLVLKFYPDTIIFYGFLEALALIALVGIYSPRFRFILTKRKPGKTSTGEQLTCLLLLSTIALWTYYWASQHWWGHKTWKFNKGGGVSSAVTATSEVVARTFGMEAVFFMSLCLLPASRNSLWLEAIGVSWESSLWMHRWLGAAMMLTMIGHVLGFWVRWYEMGILANDLFPLHGSFYPLAPHTKLGSEPQGADMTIEMMQLIGYPALVFMGVFPPLRRKNYELFKYFHYMFLVLVPAAILHAHNGWYFPLGGVAFWLVDASIRFVNASSPCELLDAKAHDAEEGVTELSFKKPFSEPGMYCFINIPQISKLQWHPFSLSSSPLDDCASMHIKSMGTGEFTGKLLELAKQHATGGPSFTLNVEGPYGPPIELQGYHSIVLLAGGIGITPMHSTFRYLMQLANKKQIPATLTNVHLALVCRTPGFAQIFKHSIDEVLAQPLLGITFSATLYLTGSAEITGQKMQVVRGRPDFEKLYEQFQQNSNGAGKVLVKLCAPVAMDIAAAKAANDCEYISYESEVFVM